MEDAFHSPEYVPSAELVSVGVNLASQDRPSDFSEFGLLALLVMAYIMRRSVICAAISLRIWTWLWHVYDFALHVHRYTSHTPSINDFI